ncbi:MAG TPA: DM13 domain-containing protein [Ferruginibacter sp.]|nr:DM13 domain-containing protein [Ferruginibacter sp.]
MKKTVPLFVFSLLLVLASCKKNNTPPIVLNEMADSTALPVQTGVFSNGPYGSVSGQARILQTGSVYELKLMNFSSSNGPDLRVYLSKEMFPVNFIDLGALKATGGNQLYPISGMPDFTQYKYVLVHCRQYNHLFGWALLQ